jgi:hypothetical protein
MEWIIGIIVVIVILVAFSSKKSSESNKREVRSYNDVKEEIVSSNPALDKMLNEFVDIGVQAVLSTEMSEVEKLNILGEAVGSINEHAFEPYDYISKIIKSSYQRMIGDTERYNSDAIKSMKVDLALFKNKTIEYSDYETLINHSMNYLKDKQVVVEKVRYEFLETEEDRERKNSLYEHYLEVNKDLTYQEIDAKIESGRKANYSEYTEESKMEFRALKTLQERIKTKNFRDYFVERKFENDTISSAELKRMVENISFYQSSYKMEAIPEDILNDAKSTVAKKEYEEVRDSLISKSIQQLKSWMGKRDQTSLPAKIQEYFQYRLDNEEEEYRLIKEATRLRNNLNQQSKAGNFEKVKEYEPLLAEQEKKLTDFRNSFFEELHN